ncbi:MAG TPA: nicotinamide-nucleotide amidohydrolase family protein [Chloroflexota bacterium]
MPEVEALAAALEAHHYDLAVAESCTGGSLAAAITDLPGSSSFFVGGVVAYSNDLKEQLLGVPSATLQRHGAVSEETARAMAEGIRSRTGSAMGVSTTGIAGPGGATENKPVGLVYIGVATPDGVEVRRDVWPGGRAEVRAASVRAALSLALEALGSPLDK